MRIDNADVIARVAYEAARAVASSDGPGWHEAEPEAQRAAVERVRAALAGAFPDREPLFRAVVLAMTGEPVEPAAPKAKPAPAQEPTEEPAPAKVAAPSKSARKGR